MLHLVLSHYLNGFMGKLIRVCLIGGYEVVVKINYFRALYRGRH